MAKDKKTETGRVAQGIAQAEAPATPPTIQPAVCISNTSNGHVLYRQDEVDPANSRKILDSLLYDVPPGAGMTVTIATNGRVFDFPVTSIDVGSVVRQYNGIKVRKAK